MVAQFSYTKLLSSSMTINPQESNVVRNQLADGYPSQFDKFSSNFITYQLVYLLTTAQYQSFLTWWKTNKSQFFDFVDPVDGNTYQGRMVDGTFSANPFTPRQNYFTVSMTIERVV